MTEPDRSTAAVPASGTPVPPFAAQTIAGTIDAPGETVPTTLDLVAGQLAVRATARRRAARRSTTGSLRPGGTQYGGMPYVCNDLGRIDVDESGPWSIVVASYGGGTGAYAAELHPIRPDTVVPARRRSPDDGRDHSTR